MASSLPSLPAVFRPGPEGSRWIKSLQEGVEACFCWGFLDLCPSGDFGGVCGLNACVEHSPPSCRARHAASPLSFTLPVTCTNSSSFSLPTTLASVLGSMRLLRIAGRHSLPPTPRSPAAGRLRRSRIRQDRGRRCSPVPRVATPLVPGPRLSAQGSSPRRWARRCRRKLFQIGLEQGAVLAVLDRFPEERFLIRIASGGCRRRWWAGCRVRLSPAPPCRSEDVSHGTCFLPVAFITAARTAR